MTESAAGFCSSCGAPRQDRAARFCGNCGRPFNVVVGRAPEPAFESPRASEPRRPSGPSTGGAIKQGFGWAAGCLLFLIVALIVLAYLLGAGR